MIETTATRWNPPLVMSRTIRSCPNDFAVRRRCDKRWESLAPTEDVDVRHCGVCAKDVHFCRTDEETIRHALARHCIAREVPDGSETPPVVLGHSGTRWTPRQERAIALTIRENDIAWAIGDGVADDATQCPSCGYPLPSRAKRCRVCGGDVGPSSPTD